jgi:hypothetical protein
MNTKTFITTRQNSKGNWWCSTTYKGYDYSEEETTASNARYKIQQALGLSTEKVIWEDSKFYISKKDSFKETIPVERRTSRIDNHPIG